MRLVLKKSDRTHLRNCCKRQPIVGAVIDFADEYEPSFDIYCPVCERTVIKPSFEDAKRVWNHETYKPGDLIIPPEVPE